MGTTEQWSRYIERFHRDRPGITEAVLARALDDDGIDPYQWLTSSLPGRGPVVDLGCGSGPTSRGIPGWIGLDVSMPELQCARSRGRSRLVQARAEAAPIATGSVAGVVAAMSLMVTDDAAAVLAEAARLLEPGGSIVLLLPALGPLTAMDRVRYAGLLLAVGRTAMPFPRPEVGHDVTRLLDVAGLEVRADEARRFAYRTGTAASADLLIDSLYLPGVSATRVRLARFVARHWGASPLGIPLRRLIARRRTDR